MHMFACPTDVINLRHFFCLEITGTPKLVFHPNLDIGWREFSVYMAIKISLFTYCDANDIHFALCGQSALLERPETKVECCEYETSK